MGKQSQRRPRGGDDVSSALENMVLPSAAASAARETLRGHGVAEPTTAPRWESKGMFTGMKDLFRKEEESYMANLDKTSPKHSWSRTKVRRVFAANCAIADAFEGTRWEACGGGMMRCTDLPQGPLVRDVQFWLRNDNHTEWSVKINSDMELVADGGCPRRAKEIILGALDEMKNSDIMPKKCSFCAAPCKNRKCARCKKAVYCSAACQKSAWKTHKAESKPAPG